MGPLHKNIGLDYVETLLLPAGRGTVAEHLNAESGASGESIGPPYLFLQEVLIKGIRFPPEAQAAVNRKTMQYKFNRNTHTGWNVSGWRASGRKLGLRGLPVSKACSARDLGLVLAVGTELTRLSRALIRAIPSSRVRERQGRNAANPEDAPTRLPPGQRP